MRDLLLGRFMPTIRVEGGFGIYFTAAVLEMTGDGDENDPGS